jgi:hypothetical protein
MAFLVIEIAEQSVKQTSELHSKNEVKMFKKENKRLTLYFVFLLLLPHQYPPHPFPNG